jgi:hypothetical protein
LSGKRPFGEPAVVTGEPGFANRLAKLFFFGEQWIETMRAPDAVQENGFEARGLQNHLA